MIGFKPQEIIDLLDVGSQRFRYWRKNLDPMPHRPKFTARDALAYHILKVLILRRGISVKELVLFDTKQLFDWCHNVTMVEAENTLIILDTETRVMQFLPAQTSIDTYNLNLYYLQLRDVILHHQKCLFNFGL